MKEKYPMFSHMREIVDEQAVKSSLLTLIEFTKTASKLKCADKILDEMDLSNEALAETLSVVEKLAVENCSFLVEKIETDMDSDEEHAVLCMPLGKVLIEYGEAWQLVRDLKQVLDDAGDE